MILTEPTKSVFTKWIYDNKKYNEVFVEREAGEWNHGGTVELSVSDILDKIPEIFLNSIIIEWFDTIGITVDVMPRMNDDKIVFEPNTFCLKHEITTEDFSQFELRNKAIEKAIEKANNIFTQFFV